MRRFLPFLALAVWAASVEGQTLRKTRTRAIVQDSSCIGEPAAWRSRDATYRTMTEASIAARTKLPCPLVTPPPPPPPPVDTTPFPPPVIVPPTPSGTVDTILNADRMDQRQPLVWFAQRGDAGSATIDTFTFDRGGYRGHNPTDPAEAGGDIRVICTFVKSGQFDPIVFPGQARAGHMHDFFGRVNVTGSFPQTGGTQDASTCAGGMANGTAYWAPTVFDQRNGEIHHAERVVVYYKTSYRDGLIPIREMPFGMKIIAGNKDAMASQERVQWYCQATGARSPADGSIPPCPVGGIIELSVLFPDCWDGVNLDSPNHQSHMAYLQYVWDGTSSNAQCPTTHPVHVVQIGELFEYRIKATDDLQSWCFSSNMPGQPCARGGHADWWNGWQPSLMQWMTAQCLNARLDCGVNDLGGNLLLRNPPRQRIP